MRRTQNGLDAYGTELPWDTMNAPFDTGADGDVVMSVKMTQFPDAGADLRRGAEWASSFWDERGSRGTALSIRRSH